MDYICLSTDLNNCKLEPSQCSTGIDTVVNGIDCPTFGTTLKEKEYDQEEDEEVLYGEHLEPLDYKEDMEMDTELFGDIAIDYAQKKKIIQATSSESGMIRMVLVAVLFVIGMVGLIYAILRAMKSSNKSEYQSLV
eukprot:CAMPEP_0201595350 /NCGR_PEP_ID=MMETSP0190_2-20130828/192377_1 /ASSEMBLY_ACC=CAM_ASM_000263 /TAXON_ID=37353 /ORGANISM="Rosalina sp." /LENGTH=135 /DNA_ID=CAMNT_0048055295 /DNA_START=824 /DNA_END=1231 /DNA_ORIENTATION=-